VLVQGYFKLHYILYNVLYEALVAQAVQDMKVLCRNGGEDGKGVRSSYVVWFHGAQRYCCMHQ
jgi:hypothetical protein